jgi:hypothetical protein
MRPYLNWIEERSTKPNVASSSLAGRAVFLCSPVQGGHCLGVVVWVALGTAGESYFADCPIVIVGAGTSGLSTGLRLA